MPYPQQLEDKARIFASLCGPLYTGQTHITPARDTWYYRNKVELSFKASSEDGSGIILGFKEKGRWYSVIDLKECLIFSPDIPEIVSAVKAWALRADLSAYNARRHTGLLRHLVLRRSEQNRLSLMLVTTSQQAFDTSTLRAALSTLPHPPSVILHGINDAPADTALPQSTTLIAGEPWLEEFLLDWNLRYHVTSFFQTNPPSFSLLLKDILHDAVNLAKAGDISCIWDLYCGIGTIAIPIAIETGLPVIGIESHPQSIEDAIANAKRLAAEMTADGRLTFKAEKVEDAAKELSQDERMRDSLVILDPPRSGLHPKVRKAMLTAEPRNIFYVSCNPKLTARDDLPPLLEKYKIVKAEAYDFFPHTEHFEAFFSLERVQ